MSVDVIPHHDDVILFRHRPYGKTQDEGIMKESSDESPEEAERSERKNHLDITSREREIQYLEQEKDNSHNIPKECSTDDRNASCSLGNKGLKKTISESSSEEESNSASIRVKPDSVKKDSIEESSYDESETSDNESRVRKSKRRVREEETVQYSRLRSSPSLESDTPMASQVTRDTLEEEAATTPIVTSKPAVASAAFTALFSAFSPLGRRGDSEEPKSSRDAEEAEDEVKKEARRKPKVFAKVPGEPNAVIIPLHGSSDEEESDSIEERHACPGDRAPSNGQDSIVDEGDGLIQALNAPSLDARRSSNSEASQATPLQGQPTTARQTPMSRTPGEPDSQAQPSEEETQPPQRLDRLDSTISDITPIHTIQRIYLEDSNETTPVINDESLVVVKPTVATAALTSLLGAITPLAEVEQPAKDEDTKPPDETIQRVRSRKKKRVFQKVPNENAVFVPLHGSTDDAECSTSEEDKEKDEASANYDVYVPLHGNQEEDTSKPTTEPNESAKRYAEEHQTIATAAFSSLFSAFSPLVAHESNANASQGSILNENETNETSTIPTAVQRKPKSFKKLPNQNAFYIPLHGSSEEDDKMLSESDNSNSNLPEQNKEQNEEVKKEDDVIPRDSNIEGGSDFAVSHPTVTSAAFTSVRSAMSPLGALESPNNEVRDQEERAISRPAEENSRDSNTEGGSDFAVSHPTVASAAFTSVRSAMSPLGALESPNNEVRDQEERAISRPAEEKSRTQKKPRMFKKVPNQNAVYVPLHGSSDEENQEEDSQPSNESIKESEGNEPAPNEYYIYVPLFDNDNHKSNPEQAESPKEDLKSPNKKDAAKAEEYAVKHPALASAAFAGVFSAFSPLQGSGTPAEDHPEPIYTTEISDTQQSMEVHPVVDNQNEDVQLEHVPQPGVTKESISKETKQADAAKAEEYAVKHPALASAAFAGVFSAFSPLQSSKNTTPIEETTESFIQTEKNDIQKEEATTSENKEMLEKPKEEEIPPQVSEEIKISHGESDKPLKTEDIKKAEEFAVKHPAIASAAFAGVFVAMPPLKIKDDKNQAPSEGDKDDQPETREPIKPKKQKVFKKISNEDAFYIPLHGSSDEVDENVSNEEFLSTPVQEEILSKETSENVPKVDDSPTDKNIGDANQEIAVTKETVVKKSDEQAIDQSKGKKLEGEIKDEDKLKSNGKNLNHHTDNINQPAVASAAFSALFSAFSPLAKDKEVTEEPKVQEEAEDEVIKIERRKPKIFKKIPNENAFIVPLHSSSDEVEEGEENVEPKLIQDNKEKSNDVQDSPVADSNESKGDNNSKNITSEGRRESGKRDLEVAASQPTVASAAFSALFSSFSPLGGKPKNQQSITEEDEEETQEPTKEEVKKKQRIFKKVPNQNAVFVPLHSSDEESVEEVSGERRPSNISIPRSMEHMSDEPNKYSIHVPLHGEEGEVKQEEKKPQKIAQEKENVLVSQPSVATAAFTALYSASIAPADNDNARGVKTETDKPTKKETDKSIKEETTKPEIGDSSPSTDQPAPSDNSSEGSVQLKLEIAHERGILQIEQPTIATAAFTSLFTVFSPLGVKEGSGELFQNEDEAGEQLEKKPIRRKPRMFKKVPNENAVYVPLHSSSEEEKSEDLAEEEQSKNETDETQMNYVPDAPNEYKILVPLHEEKEQTGGKSPKRKKGKSKSDLGIPPTIAAAAYTSLFSAFSPLGSTETMKSKEDLQEQPKEEAKSVSAPVKRKQFKKLPNENAYFIPLHSSTEEEGDKNKEIVDVAKEETNDQLEPVVEIEKEPISDEAKETEIKVTSEPAKTDVTETTEEKEAIKVSNDDNKEEPKKKGVIINEEENIEIEGPQTVEVSQPTVAAAAFTALFSAFSPLGKSEVPEEKAAEEIERKKKENEAKEKKEKVAKKSILKRPKGSSESKDAEKEQELVENKEAQSENKSASTPDVAMEEPIKVIVKKLDSVEKISKASDSLEVMSIKDSEVPSALDVDKPAQAANESIPCDHEYEPIQVGRAASQPDIRRSRSAERKLKRQEETYEVVQPQESKELEETTPALQAEGGYELIEEPKPVEQRRCIKIPNQDAIIVPLHGSSDEEINPDRYQNPALMLSEEEIESFPKQPLPFVNIPNSDDMANAPPPHHETFKEKLQTQADRFTTKLKGISKPNITIHKPNIKLPQRPKMPDMPKIKLPDRSRFHLPDRSKFHLPDRSKFHLPDASKFHLPEKPKFLTERPRFKLPERFQREKKTKGPRGKKPNPSSQRRPLRDVVTISSHSTPGSSHNIFETIKFKTYPRFFKKKKPPPVAKMSSMETESSATPPRRPRRFSDQQRDTTWVHAYDRDIRFADEETNLRVEAMEEEYEREEHTAPFHEHFDTRATRFEDNLTQAKAESMTSVASEKGSSGSSSNRRRAGVIEEIDSDEFFVRQKGLSREDVAVSRYLSLEIRDAFRQPKNALASLDNEMYDDDDQEDIRFEHLPRAPVRSKSHKSASADRAKEAEFHTFPKRPTRMKESDPEVNLVAKPPRRFRSKSGGKYRGRQTSMPSLSQPEQEQAEGPPPQPPRRKSRERSLRSLNREGRASDLDIVQTRVTAHHSGEIPPVAPLRKSRSRGTSLADDDRTSRGADSSILPDDDEIPQAPPRREKEHEEDIMMADEDIEVDVEGGIEENEIIVLEHQPLEPAQTQDSLHVYERYSDHPGYAVVTKDKKKPPPRPPPPPTSHHFDFQNFQSQLDNIRSTGKNIFFTYPRRAIRSLQKPVPNRPLRKYNTLGPVRPPRRNRVFRKPVYMTGETPNQQELGDKERDLQSGEVVSKMKGRPLPAPPRPPRKSRDYDVLIGEGLESSATDTLATETIVPETAEEEERIEDEAKESTASFLRRKRDDFLKSIFKFSSEEKEEEPKEQMSTSQQTSFDLGEVNVSVQTDPLPKDVIVIDQEIEETQEILILSDQSSRELLDKSETDSKKSPTQLKERKVEEEKKTKPEENAEANIFQQALERVEAAKGVLKEARERVTPGSTTSLDKKPAEESSSSFLRVSRAESLPTSSRSPEVEKEETPPPFPARPTHTKPIPVSFPEKLHLTELDVDKLSVQEIQASKIKVSEIESTCIEVTELNSQGGNLTLSGLELPPDFINNVVEQVASQVQSRVREHVESLQQAQREVVEREAELRKTLQLETEMRQALQREREADLRQREREERRRESERRLTPQREEILRETTPQRQNVLRETTPQRQMRRILTPPPPIVVQATAEPVQLPEPMAPQSVVQEHIPQPRTTKSKGRKSPTRVIDDSEDELAALMPQRRAKEKEKKQDVEKKHEPEKKHETEMKRETEKKQETDKSKEEDPPVPSPPLSPRSGIQRPNSLELLGMLVSIWQENIVAGAGSFAEGVNSLFPEGEKRRDAQIAAVILLILITGLIIIGFGYDHSVHHHHWDYLPPR